MFARQLCRRIPVRPGLRPVVLRPTLSGGLPLSGYESVRSLRWSTAKWLPWTMELKWLKIMAGASPRGHF